MGMPEAPELVGSPRDVKFFKLMDRHLSRGFIWIMRHLPSDPRCRLARMPAVRAPFRAARVRALRV